MPTLAFKARFVEPIVDGTKDQTLRKACSMQPGDVIVCTCRWGDPPFARVRVTRVEAVERADLGERDAAADGFASLEELTDFLDDAYGDVETLARISFELVDEGT